MGDLKLPKLWCTTNLRGGQFLDLAYTVCVPKVDIKIFNAILEDNILGAKWPKVAKIGPRLPDWLKVVRKFNLKISPSKFCKQLYLGHPVLILTLKSKCFKKGWTGKGKPVSFPSISDMWLPSEAGGGSGTGRGGGRWFQRRRQDDPQEQASLLCWMNIHKCVSYFWDVNMSLCHYYQ